jgi:hypothetical protein
MHLEGEGETVDAGVRKRRQTAAQPRARARRSGRDAAPSTYLLHELSHLRSLLTAARERLAVKKERAAVLILLRASTQSSFKNSGAPLIRRPQSDARESASATLASDHAVSLRHLEALHKIELERAKATAVAAREQDKLKLDRLVAKRPGPG